ncbi:RNA polymerase factor sigma-54 [Tropicimonas isoalkanivorans]|uniref:RNA polymerase sigma-54 factor n=1 Tax=Tropicimonas isoalkanivorans TaxID=441112 RepID=A0A1I1QDX5_9RHOB|nr:hypothetical protein [Tropicimonas isoalkanivorans]SFD20217.1 RNA polymerase, sigma 54 subunit, RpoN/SigL [Tropicimonas isoalkanivorans]
MSLGLQVRNSQAQIFGLGQVVEILQMSVDDLENHLKGIAATNPFVTVDRHMWTSANMAAPAEVIEATAAQPCTGLYDHVLRELAGLLSRGGPVERLVLGLIDHLEPSGWLDRSVAEIAESLGVTEEVIEAALKLVQGRVTPAGLFARDLTDCLRLQLEDRDLLTEPMVRVLGHLNVLESGGVDAMSAATGLSKQDIGRYLSQIRRLDPKPGCQFCNDPALEREPDVTVRVSQTGVEIGFRSAAVPDIAIADVPRTQSGPETREALSRARSLKRMLDLRRSALEQVVGCLVERQKDFFLKGAEAQCVLSLSEIAEETGFHLSTVSRVLNGLLIEGPGGIVPARSLCSSSASAGSEHSKPKVQARIKALVSAETHDRPVCDGRLVTLLIAEGIFVSRRVVAKYRQEIGIPAVSKRRQRLDDAGVMRHTHPVTAKR